MVSKINSKSKNKYSLIHVALQAHWLRPLLLEYFRGLSEDLSKHPTAAVEEQRSPCIFPLASTAPDLANIYNNEGGKRTGIRLSSSFIATIKVESWTRIARASTSSLTLFFEFVVELYGWSAPFLNISLEEQVIVLDSIFFHHLPAHIQVQPAHHIQRTTSVRQEKHLKFENWQRCVRGTTETYPTMLREDEAICKECCKNSCGYHQTPSNNKP